MAFAGLAAAWLLTYPPLVEALPELPLVVIAVFGALFAGWLVGWTNGKLITQFQPAALYGLVREYWGFRAALRLALWVVGR